MNDLAASDDPNEILVQLRAKRSITARDVATLRASELGTGLRTMAQAEALMDMERGGLETCRAWGDFLVETMLDFMIWDEQPAGALTEARALWLCDQVGDRPSPACMALLIAVLDEAAGVPAWFPEAVRTRAQTVFARHRTGAANALAA